MRTLFASHRMLPRHPVAAVLAPLLVASGIGGFLTGQIAGHLPRGLALMPPAHQKSGRVQGSLGQRVGAQVAHQPAIQTLYVHNPSPLHANARQNGGHGAHGKDGHGDGKGDGGKHGKHGKGGHGGGHGGNGNDGGGGQHGHGGGTAGSHGGHD